MKAPGLEGSGVPRLQRLRVSGLEGVLGFPGFRRPRFQGLRGPGPEGSGIPRLQRLRVSGLEGTRA